MLGTYALSSGYYEAYYGRAQRVRTKIADDFAAAFERFDFVVTPTSPDGRLQARRARPTTRWRCTCRTTARCRCRWPGIPAISIPAGLAEPDGGGRSCRSASRSPGPAFSENAHPRRRLRARAGDRLRRDRPERAGAASMPSCEPVIGLEIHVQLATRTKMFCGCELSFGEEPNTHTCPVCLGHPGHAAGRQRAGDPLRADDRAGARLRDRAAVDLPPQELLLSRPARRATRSASTTSRSASGGRLGDVRIHRVHLEEDAAKLIHVGESGRIHGSGASLVDFNRGGTPLVEIVTEPDLRSPAEAREWLQLLRDDAPPARRLRREHGGGQRCAATPTSRSARPAATSSAPRPSSRT